MPRVRETKKQSAQVTAGPTKLEGEAALALRSMLRTVDLTMGTGRPSKTFCSQCVDTGIHNTSYRQCQCGCHDARKVLVDYDAKYAKAEAA
jgi:hypothetical protein|tara:strand:+ start:176 stop:448 length:273 start_codon:yes stop_codon:yes gene_type:complete